MTSIPALVPSNKENPAAQLLLGAAADTKEPATSFAKLLDDANDGSKKVHKTPAHPVYSFAELGMFGLHATALAPDANAKPAAAAKLLAPTVDTASRMDEIHSAIAPAPLIYVPSLNVAASPMATQQQVAAATGARAPAAPAAVSTLPSSKAPAKATVPAAARTASATVAKLAAPNAVRKALDPVAVTVAGTQDELHIAMRSQNQSPVEVVNLRRLVETTVAQFEMAIAELHINGQAGSDPTFSIMGGADGGRTG